MVLLQTGFLTDINYLNWWQSDVQDYKLFVKIKY